MDVPLDFRTANSLWASVLVETLARLGVREVVISPGSRSTPLTLAFARHPAFDAVPVLDERSAAFFAVGLARQHQRPVVLVCTSGTAGANYFPAVIEAQEARVPLLVLTADRPPELRDCASGQTIDQQKLFGAHVNHYHELAVPEASLAQLAYLRQTVAHACRRTLEPFAGPVHLNVPFRDPLAPPSEPGSPGISHDIDETFFAHLSAAIPTLTSSVLWQRPTTARGLIVAGAPDARDAAAYVAHVRGLSERLGWPVLADALSPLRTAGGANVITCYDAVLRDATLARDLTPRTVLCLGGWPTSKVLRGWLEASGAEVLLVAPGASNRDALHGRTRQVSACASSLAVAGAAVADDAYLRAWRAAETAARTWLDQALEAETTLFEPKACWLLARHLPEGTAVFVASSMPVRDVEYVWPANGRNLELHFNRGANGIDGTLSTAMGVSRGRRGVLLTGDLALLHDTNGFLLRAKQRGSLTVVLINNGGGGIFEHLPVAQHQPVFEEFFATPQSVDFAKLCAAYGAEHVVVRDWEQFTGLISTLPESGLRVLEVRTDRKRDAAWRKSWLSQAGRAAAARPE